MLHSDEATDHAPTIKVKKNAEGYNYMYTVALRLYCIAAGTIGGI